MQGHHHKSTTTGGPWQRSVRLHAGMSMQGASTVARLHGELCSRQLTTKSLRMFSSDAPTYLFSTSGPFTTLGSRPFSILPICRAISVLPAIAAHRVLTCKARSLSAQRDASRDA